MAITLPKAAPALPMQPQAARLRYCAKTLREAGHLSDLDYHRIINRIAAVERARSDP